MLLKLLCRIGKANSMVIVTISTDGQIMKTRRNMMENMFYFQCEQTARGIAVWKGWFMERNLIPQNCR